MEPSSSTTPDQNLAPVAPCEACGATETCSHRTVRGPGGLWAFLGIALLLLSIGLWGGAGGFYLAHQDHTLVSNGVHSSGTVADVELRVYRYGSVDAIMGVSFVADDGKQYLAEGRERYNERRDGTRKEFAAGLMGSEVTVFYDPANPDKSVVEGSERPYAGPILGLVFLGLGALGCLITWAGFIGLRQEQRNQRSLQEP